MSNRYRGRGRRSRPIVDVYTDGCCLNNGRDDAKAGIGVYFDEYDGM